MVGLYENNICTNMSAMSIDTNHENDDSMPYKVTFTQALRDKYIDQQEVDNQLVLPKDNKISTSIVYVGFGKVSRAQKQLIGLISIDLSSKFIYSCGDFSELMGGLNRVEILNLANNQLSWKEIVSIIDHLPRLKDLVLTDNKLLDNKIEGRQDDSKPQKTLVSLTLGHMRRDWTSILKILSSIWISIEQLDLWDSKLCSEDILLESTEYDSFIRGLSSLKLSYNLFTDIDCLKTIGPIENLRELDLSRCKLEKLSLSVEEAECLKNLEILNVSYNNLTSWKCIANLYRLKNLRSLICHENPVFILEKDAKSLTIGRLGQIQFINREEISNTMRRDSEVLYIRRSFPDYQLYCKGENTEFKADHPRYEELAEVYGLPEDLTRKQVVDKYVHVFLCYKENKIKKKLPCDMRIANLQMFCKRLFKIRPSNSIRIICRYAEHCDNALNYELDKDGQTLHFFSVENDHELVIQEIN